MAETPRLVLISGPVGVGKTTAMLEVSSQLNAIEVPHAAIDMDALGWCYPAPDDDPYNQELCFGNLRSLAQTYSRGRSLRYVLIARVIESADELPRYQECFPGFEITTFRLSASTETLSARVTGRELGSDREWSIQRALELAESLQVGEFEIDTTSLDVTEVAHRIIAILGLP